MNYPRRTEDKTNVKNDQRKRDKSARCIVTSHFVSNTIIKLTRKLCYRKDDRAMRAI